MDVVCKKKLFPMVTGGSRISRRGDPASQGWGLLMWLVFEKVVCQNERIRTRRGCEGTRPLDPPLRVYCGKLQMLPKHKTVTFAFCTSSAIYFILHSVIRGSDN